METENIFVHRNKDNKINNQIVNLGTGSELRIKDYARIICDYVEYNYEDIEFDDIRYSTGLSAIWISPFGALSASYAMPFAEKSSDQLQNFQFTFGTSF